MIDSKPRVFVDSDVLFAASATGSTTSASLVLLRMSEITLIDAVASEQVVTEVERNLTNKFPNALPALQLLIHRSLRIVPNPTIEQIKSHVGKADEKDLPILVAAHLAECPSLVSFNIRHFQPGIDGIDVMRPGQFVQRIRYLLAGM